MPRSVGRHAAPPLSCSRNQATAIMADHSGLDNDSGFDSPIEAHRREMLAAPAAMGLGENAAHRPYFGVEMAAQCGFAMAAQAAGAIFDDLAGDLWHAGRGCARARGVGKNVQISEPAFLDQVDGTAEHVLALGRKSGNEIRPEHDVWASSPQFPGE